MYKVLPTKNGKYIWYTEQSQLKNIIEAIVDHFVKIPFITLVKQNLHKNRLLNHTDIELLSLLTAINPTVTVLNIDTLEVGAAVPLEVKITPKTEKMPKLRIESDNNDIITASETTLYALNSGETEIRVFAADALTPITRMRISVFKNNKIERIILDRAEPNMGIGKEQQISISLFPANAEDRDFVVWSVDNPNIATVNQNGVVITKGVGRVTVSASTLNVKESVVIDVLPNINSITLSETKFKIVKGASEKIGVSYSPSLCYDAGYHWLTNDSNVASVEVLPDGSSVIKTKEPGKCTLTCVANEGFSSATCEVEVCTEEDLEKEFIQNVGLPIGLSVLVILIFLLYFFN